ncbi:MAG: hypothetical protein BMS9Abin23_0777 [Thermodesulfobacteriota bacterium]|nr:MAG: hypothetical protein BMS9Abin23_0777 [Thermodesulfobacteriota bacterium]
MAAEAIKVKPSPSYGAPIPGDFKAGMLIIMAGAAITALMAVAGSSYTTGFAAGYLLGVVNLVWLYLIVRKSLTITSEKAMRYVMPRCYLRFLVTAAIIFFTIMLGFVHNPWPPLTGISASIFIAIGSMVFTAKELFK